MTQRDLFDKKQPPEPVTYTHYPDVSIPVKPYHKTTALEPGEHEQRTEKAKTQDELVLAFFQKNPSQKWSASQVHQIVFPPKVPLTSARRSCTNLMNAGHLKKLAETRPSIYGAKEHYYRLVQP